MTCNVFSGTLKLLNSTRSHNYWLNSMLVELASRVW